MDRKGLKETVNSYGQCLNNLEVPATDTRDRVSVLEKTCAALVTNNAKLKGKRDDLENRSRKQNLHIMGLPEGLEGHNSTKYMADFFLEIFGDSVLESLPELDRAGYRKIKRGLRKRRQWATDQGRSGKEKGDELTDLRTKEGERKMVLTEEVVRAGRIIPAMLASFVESNQSNWDSLLPYVMMAYRTSVQASTGHTPCKVMFGREITLNIELLTNTELQGRYPCVTDYVSKLAGYLSTVEEAVKRHQKRVSEKQKEHYDLKVTSEVYSEGELVWVRNQSRKKGLCPKLHRRFRGPFKIVKNNLRSGL
ncbi:UNVERIFIED_CONTAM: hypothetical protein FKN15_025172 [Acipenser sinensis]